MREVKAVFYALSISSLRDKATLFWSFVFPIILLVILVSVFGNLDQTLAQLVFDVGLVVDESPENSSSGRLVKSVLSEMASADDAWLTLHQGGILPEELTALERGQRHAVVHVSGNAATVHIHSGRLMSEIAGDALEQVLGALNLEFNRQLGLVSGPAVRTVYRDVEISPGEVLFNYSAYIVPGIILMVFMNSGLGPMIQGLALDRERGILRRFFATPLTPMHYFAGLILYILARSVVQVMLIYWAGVLLFDVHINLLAWKPLLFLVFSLVTMISLGVVIAGMAKTANGAAAAVNGLMYPMMFLGGLYFPVLHLTYPLKLIVVANPVTYLVNGLRDSLGIYPSATSPWLNIAVPALYILASLVVGLRSFKWDA